MKICTKCKIEKESTEFYSDNRRKDGLRSWCKTCHLDDSKKREPSYLEYRKEYRDLNKENKKSKNKIYYQNNKDHLLFLGRQWRTTTFNGRLNSYKRSAIKRNIKWELTTDEFKLFWQNNCNYCNSPIATIGLDRIDSTKSYNINNVVSCCYQCNIMKMDYSIVEFLEKIKQIYELQRSKGLFN